MPEADISNAFIESAVGEKAEYRLSIDTGDKSFFITMFCDECEWFEGVRCDEDSGISILSLLDRARSSDRFSAFHQLIEVSGRNRIGQNVVSVTAEILWKAIDVANTAFNSARESRLRSALADLPAA
jgi:hypothetical protein